VRAERLQQIVFGYVTGKITDKDIHISSGVGN
jgi:hypothetical protein